MIKHNNLGIEVICDSSSFVRSDECSHYLYYMDMHHNFIELEKRMLEDGWKIIYELEEFEQFNHPLKVANHICPACQPELNIS